MNTMKLKKFAQGARRQLLEQVAARLEQVLRSDSVEIREKAKTVAELRGQIDAHGKEAVIDRVAYTWFNRFCALRFMDVNHYTRIGAVSPVEGGTQPEVLFEAKQGHIDEELLKDEKKRKEVFSLLNGQRPASDPQGEAYRLLLVGICNSYNGVMPFMFEKIEDYTELLMPLDLLSENSVLHDLREALTTETCQDVEVIGWLYQYYISERKDQVFEALKQNQKIEAADIPAATQLFTPHWIVRYLVENSLGRLWMLNHPASRLVEKMEYYIAPADDVTASDSEAVSSAGVTASRSLAKQSPENGEIASGEEQERPRNDMLVINSPEELRLLDPACGSGHILTYAFDLLYAIYEEEGYAASDIPKLILEKNIFGIEIDPRAGALAAFALVMKARAKDKRFFTREVNPNICVLENVTFNEAELKQYMNAVGRDLFTEPLKETLRQFEQADNFGSLIRPMLTDAGYVRGLLEGKNLGGDLFLFGVHERVLKVLKQAEFLAPRYHVVVANPPYMGGAGMNEQLKTFVGTEYPDAKSDLMTCFMERCATLSVKNSLIGMINLPSWLFLDSFNEFRYKLLSEMTIQSLIHLGRGMFGADFGCVSFVLKNGKPSEFVGTYRRLFVKQSEVSSVEELERRFHDKQYGHFSVNQNEFIRLPGYAIGYWISPNMRRAFIELDSLEDIADARIGMATGRNEYYLRNWHEVGLLTIGFNMVSREDAKQSDKKWFPHAKGGEFRKWYGNSDHLVNWHNDGQELQTTLHPSGKRVWAHNFNLDQIFKPAICWTTVTIADTGFRYHPAGYLYDAAAGLCQPKQAEDMLLVLGALNSRVSMNAIKLLNPTVNLAPGYLGKIPVERKAAEIAAPIVKRNLEIAKNDWDSFETSWDFTNLPLLKYDRHLHTLKSSYEKLRTQWQEITLEMQKAEEKVNSIFIKAYGLQNEMVSDVPLNEITVTCNPNYRYRGNRNTEGLEELMRADTMKEFISYAVGCMFGRYSLDKPGLVLANQGETVKDYLKQVPKPTFMPDEDNVIPVLEGEWFEDDIAERFKKFLRVTFGEERYDENLAFIEESIGRDVRSYFVKEFYKDHVQTYKKRPIYWMFSSPKGSFNALIYMHRYQPDTVSIVLNDYLREYIKKLQAHKSHLDVVSVSGSASQSQKTKALKEITQVNKVLSELKEYERDVLFPLANERVRIDLDDGVKVNYGKFGTALKPISGL